MSSSRMVPAEGCCHCFSLALGVEIICAAHLILCVATLCTISSTHNMEFGADGEVWISPKAQVYFGTWAAIGIPVIIGAGVGAVFRIGPMLTQYCRYLLLSFVGFFAGGVYSIIQGQVCAATVGKELRNAESASLACNLMDSVAVLWLCGMTLVFLYSGYIVWSCAEVIRLNFFPELREYRRRMEEKGMVGDPFHSALLEKQDDFAKRHEEVALLHGGGMA